VPQNPSAFDIPDRLAAKAAPDLIADDELHFAAIAESLRRSVAELSDRLDEERRSPGGRGQQAMERDLEIHRLTARLRALRRYGLDLCLGRMVGAEHPEPVYVGRFGLTDADGRRLLVDWRSPAAEPFFGATHANPMGLLSRRRYRWTRGRVSDYWDEVFTSDGLVGNAALDDQSAFIASLSTSRSPRMRDVLGTIQADQDAIIRAGSRGALVVDGGPGTGKTVVALHRTAFLLYSDPRLSRQREGVLFVGPHRGYVAYVEDVLPSLGEEGVRTCTLRDLVTEGAAATIEADPAVAALKATMDVVGVVERAVRRHEEPPTTTTVIETPWADVRITAAEWAEAFGAAEPGSAHNEAREQVRQALIDIIVDTLTDRQDDDEPEEEAGFDAYGLDREDEGDRLRRALGASRELEDQFDRVWPLLDPAAVVSQLWTAPELLLCCAPGLDADAAPLLYRRDGRAWTVSDLPFLDVARQRIGDPVEARARRRREAAAAAERARMADVLDDLIANDDSEMGVMSMLRGQDLKAALVDEAALPAVNPDLLAGPFAHIVVDEAQELTDAEWQMLLQRCPSRSFTIVGDRAQARHGFAESWQERLHRVGLDEVSLASLTVNYRTPAEVMAEAEPVIRAVLPDANVPTSIRSSGLPVVHGSAADLGALLDSWLAENADGIACVIGAPAFTPPPRVRSLTPELSKGLEFDLVVLVDPESVGVGIEGAVDRYVAMTRATRQLVILSTT
jgi:DNA helicase IV